MQISPHLAEGSDPERQFQGICSETQRWGVQGCAFPIAGFLQISGLTETQRPAHLREKKHRARIFFAGNCAVKLSGVHRSLVQDLWAEIRLNYTQVSSGLLVHGDTLFIQPESPSYP